MSRGGCTPAAAGNDAQAEERCAAGQVWQVLRMRYRGEVECMQGMRWPLTEAAEALTCSSTGVWRRQAIEAAGGWNSRTTVEDMDLSLRAYLAGWKAIYLRDTTVLNEAGCMIRSHAVKPYRLLTPVVLCFGMLLAPFQHSH